jgi:dienelactone hydrolase
LPPSKIIQTPRGNFIVAEGGPEVPNHDRVSIVDQDGNRHTLLDGLASARTFVGDFNGTTGVYLKGRTLFILNGQGDVTLPGPVQGTERANPTPASPIFSSVLAVHFGAAMEETTTGVVLTLVDHQALKDGQTLIRDDAEGHRVVIELVADFPDYAPEPRPNFADNVRHSHPYGVVGQGRFLYIVDAGFNIVRKLDLVTGEHETLGDKPLNGRLISEEQAEGYRHQTVRIDSAYGETFDLHLFLPRGGRVPYAPVVIMPDADAFEPQSLGWPPVIYTGRFVKGLLQEGHAICWPVYEGTFERRKAANEWSLSDSERRDRDVRIAKDLSRAIDFLQTRDDMNTDTLAYVGVSWGAIMAPTMLVVEPRFTAAVLIAGGYDEPPRLPETEPFQFAPYVKVPILMVNGRYDQTLPFESSQKPLCRDLGSADKQIRHFESGHAPPLHKTIEVVNEWLGEKLRRPATSPSRGSSN